MNDSYIRRTIEPVLERSVKEFPVVILTGPRQSGKTTVLKRLFSSKFDYVSLDAMDVREAAASDPRGFLARHTAPLIIDEVQNVPDLLTYVKEKVDEDRRLKGRFILTGSSNLLLMEKVSETLAGRTAVLKLLPLSLREIGGDPFGAPGWESPPDGNSEPRIHGGKLWEQMLRGSFPELVNEPERDAASWHSAYVQTCIERDIRSQRLVEDLSAFGDFVRGLANRSGQLLNISDIAREAGVTPNTAKSWLSLLESTYLAFRVQPFFNNLSKRISKRPKVFVLDTGLVSYLTGLETPDHARQGPMGGGLFESMVYLETLKAHLHRGLTPNICHWRTSNGAEVDLVIDRGTKVVALEAKSTETPRPAMVAGLKSFKKDYGERCAAGFIVHAGASRLPLGEGLSALPLGDL